MRKFCFTFVASFIVLLLSVVPAYAISYTDVHFASGYGFSGGSRDDGTDTVLSYYALSSLCDDVNAALSDGYYSGLSGCTAQIVSIVTSDYSYYIIRTSDGENTYSLRNSADRLVRTEYVSSTHDYYAYFIDVINALGSIDSTLNSVASYVDVTENIYTLLTTMNTHLENIETSLGVGVGTLGYNVQRTFTFISGPLYNTLLSIDTALNDPEESVLLAKLDEIKSAIENISISADNVTVSAYDDTQLLRKLTEMSNSLSTVEDILFAIMDVHTLKTSQLPRLLEGIYSKLTAFSSLYEPNSETMISQLEELKVLLSPGTQEVPTTIYDWLERRISPVSAQTSNYVSSLLSELRGFSSRIGYVNQRPLAFWVVDIYSRLGTIQSAIENVSITADNITVDAYDDTNVIAAVNAVEAALTNISFSGEVNTDLTAVVEGIGEVNTSLNVNLESLVEKLDVLVDQSTETVENLTVDIAVDSDAYNVFYVTDEDGNEESIVDFSGDVLKAGGKLLNFLFKVCFDGAISNLDGSIDDMDSFYFDGAELGGSLWE